MFALDKKPKWLTQNELLEESTLQSTGIHSLLSLCSINLKQYSHAFSFSSVNPLLCPCWCGNSLEKLVTEEIRLEGTPRDWAWLLLLSVDSSKKLREVWGQEPSPVNTGWSAGDHPKTGDGEKFRVLCGDDWDSGIIKPADDWESIETLSMLDWLRDSK